MNGDDEDSAETANLAQPAGRYRRPLALAVTGVLVVALFVVAGYGLGGFLGRRATDRDRAAAAAHGRPEVSAAPSATGPAALGPPAVRPSGSASTAAGLPVTYEAENTANTVAGGAFVAPYPGASGGRIVKNIGAWGNPGGPGALRFTDVRVPAAGAYTVTLFYVHVNGDKTRTIVISVSGSDPIRVAVTGGSSCCSRHDVTVRLPAGANTISLANAGGHAPAIDKITVGPATRP